MSETDEAPVAEPAPEPRTGPAPAADLDYDPAHQAAVAWALGEVYDLPPDYRPPAPQPAAQLPPSGPAQDISNPTVRPDGRA